MALPIKTLQDQTGTDFQPLIDGQTMVGDYTQKGTSGTLETQYTAPSNGWVYVCLHVNNGSNRTAKLTVGEKDYPVAISGQNEANYSSSVCIPVLKGDTYTASSTDSLATGGVFGSSLQGLKQIIKHLADTLQNFFTYSKESVC